MTQNKIIYNFLKKKKSLSFLLVTPFSFFIRPRETALGNRSLASLHLALFIFIFILNENKWNKKKKNKIIKGDSSHYEETNLVNKIYN
jgi:hypothetical protein